MASQRKSKKKAVPERAQPILRRIPQGIYRVCIVTTYIERLGEGMALAWALQITAPLGVQGGLLKRSRLETPEDGQTLRRELAVLGVNLVSWRGLDLARPKLHNVHAFVEVLPCALEGEDRVHILQRATTHELAPPDESTMTDDERAARAAEADFSFDAGVLSAALFAED